MNLFWTILEQIEIVDDCWLWLGHTSATGLPILKNYPSPKRISYYVFKGPTDQQIRNECNNITCLNPKHLISLNEYSKLTLEKRFWDKVEIGKDDECWEWKAAVKSTGYGNFYFDGRWLPAHRFSYIIHNNLYDLKKDTFICHSCDNRLCVNPKHLFHGTNYDNVQDMHSKERHIWGDSSHFAKYSDELIYSLYKDSLLKTPKELAVEHNIPISYLCRILNGSARKTNYKKFYNL